MIKQAFAAGLISASIQPLAMPSASAEPAEELDEARRFAPILWLARGEPAYPMLPQPFAFDGIDNNCDGRVDLADPAEIGVQFEISQMADLLNEGRIARASGIEPCVPGAWRAYGLNGGEVHWGPQARVMFVGPLDRDRVPGWNRGRAADPPTWNREIPKTTALLQYWFYYPFDMGPNPHRHDAEHVSLFVERNTDPRRSRLRAIVGAGHGLNNVNNVLVASSQHVLPDTRVVLPTLLPRHMPVLVELGKHASAPDLNCDGRFDLGADANVYAESVWGSRDVWAGVPGKEAKLGRFLPWYSFPRSPWNRLLIDDWWVGDEFESHATACPDLGQELLTQETREIAFSPQDPVQQVEKALATLELAEPQRVEAANKSRATLYQLFRLRHLYELHQLLQSPECRDDNACATKLEDFFVDPEVKQNFWGKRAGPSEVRLSPDAVQALKAWVTASAQSRLRDVWKHDAFQEPNTVFRPWLFQRFGVGAEIGRSDSGRTVMGLLLRAADFPFDDSRLELYSYFEGGIGGDMRFHRAGFDYHPSRAAIFGPYFGLGYSRSLENRLSASAGVELYFPNLPLPGWPRRLSLSMYAGLTGAVLRDAPEVIIDHPVHDPDAPTGEEIRAPLTDPLRIQFGVRLIHGFWGPKHPLSR